MTVACHDRAFGLRNTKLDQIYFILQIEKGLGLLSVDRHTYPLLKGDLMVVLPESRIQCKFDRSSFVHYCIVPPAYFNDAPHVVGEFKDFIHNEGCPATVSMPPNQSAVMAQVFRVIALELCSRREDSATAILIHLQMLLLTATRIRNGVISTPVNMR